MPADNARAELLPADFDATAATHLAAEMARSGLHDLMPWWSPDHDRILDPMDDPEVRTIVRRFVGQLWLETRRKANVR